jgi:hypothetical protein
MKKSVLFSIVLVAISVFGATLSEGATATDPKFGDQIVTVDAAHLDGAVHGVFFFNNTQFTALAVVLDADGNPSTADLSAPLNSYSYFFVDQGFGYVWGSSNLTSWTALTPAPPARVTDRILTLDKSHFNGVVHAVVFVNGTQNTAMAVVLDNFGTPSKLNTLPPPMNTYSYFFLDESSLLWGSSDGIDWEIIA